MVKPGCSDHEWFNLIVSRLIAEQTDDGFHIPLLAALCERHRARRTHKVFSVVSNPNRLPKVQVQLDEVFNTRSFVVDFWTRGKTLRATEKVPRFCEGQSFKQCGCLNRLANIQ